MKVNKNPLVRETGEANQKEIIQCCKDNGDYPRMTYLRVQISLKKRGTEELPITMNT